ncbi:MAG: MoxR family ATPase [Kiritimatiellia bacterium]
MSTDTPERAKEKLEKLKESLNQVIRGKNEVIHQLLIALLADVHVLIEDVPGTGKTTLAKALALSLNAQFSRIQFTPDLLPTDIIGGMVYSAKDGSLTFRPGPVFSNIILADEINRASPRTQSALLEAMSERQVTTEGQSRMLPQPFWVVATQNPVEHNGTYPLPEAQLDRFGMKISLGYPEFEYELRLILDQEYVHPLKAVVPVINTETLVMLREAVKSIEVEGSVLEYIVRLVSGTRRDSRLRLGASPRGTLDLRRCAQAAAFLAGRSSVRPEDVQSLAVTVLAHRLLVEVKARHSGLSNVTVIEDAVKAEPVPT